MKLCVMLSGAMMLALTAGPAFAAPAFCADNKPDFENFFFEDRSDPEAERNERDLTALRQRGIDATRVERWSGCIRAYVRQPDGGETMQFFEPNGYRPIPF
ncbi:hypothetical protein [uncultured Devosia sp.]|uniref:hypothetical protein n=1 Tax=uncultured Devosia sp. TaxID=211434 RepID=UPI0035CC9166